MLDDVTEESHVQVITKDKTFLSPHKCTLIVTARDKGFLNPEGFEFHPMERLSPDDSRTLFCKHAFQGATIRFDSLVELFLEKCDCLPPAIEVAGKYLFKRPKEVWVSALKKLGLHPLNGKAKGDGLTSILKMSYEDLAEIEQDMFLDVAQCFHGLTLSTMKRSLKICGCDSADSWQNLLDRGLVAETLRQNWERAEGDDRYVIQMHELLRDLGRSKPFPILQNASGCSEGSTPILSIENTHHRRIDIFDEEECLMNLDGRWSSQEGHHERMFLKVKHLNRWISWYISHQLKALSLEIRDCKYFIFLPSCLGKLERLERLKIENCANLEALPESMGLLSNVKHLSIQDCGRLSVLPECLGELKSLEQLTIQGCGSLKALPESLGRLQGLEHLVMEVCHSLKVLPLSLGQLPALKHLTISNCSHLKTLPSTIEELQALQYLMIQGCDKLETLPPCIGELRVLEHLTIEECHSLEDLPRKLGKLPGLKHLTISNCGLHTMPESISLLPALERLEIKQCFSLEALPKSLGQLRSLQSLALEECYSLVALPESLGQLRDLRQLTINCCPDLRSLSWTLGFLEGLHQVTIQNCQELSLLPFGWPGSLEHLPECHVTIEGCPRLPPESLRASSMRIL